MGEGGGSGCLSGKGAGAAWYICWDARFFCGLDAFGCEILLKVDEDGVLFMYTCVLTIRF